MAFKATLVMHKQLKTAAAVEAEQNGKYELVECEYEFYQSLDESGKPSSRPQSGLIKLLCLPKEMTISSSIIGCLIGQKNIMAR